MKTFRNEERGADTSPAESVANFDGNSFRQDHRVPTIKEGSPEAIMAGVLLFKDQKFKDYITPSECRHMSEILVNALSVDLTGSETAIRERMLEAGISIPQINDIFIVAKASISAVQQYGSGDFQDTATAFGRAREALLAMPQY